MTQPDPNTLSFQDHFKQLWNSVTSTWKTNEQEKKAKADRPEQQKLLVALIASERCEQPAQVLAHVMGVIEQSSKGARKPAYPMAVALETFEMLFQAVAAPVRHSAWASGGVLLASVDGQLFERLSNQVVKEKLLAQKEIAVGLNQSPTHSKM